MRKHSRVQMQKNIIASSRNVVKLFVAQTEACQKDTTISKRMVFIGKLVCFDTTVANTGKHAEGTTRHYCF